MRPGRELAALLLAGAVGAGLVLLAARQEVARVSVNAPRPFPDTARALAVQDIWPGVAALAVAALASMAAVLATRRLLRRITALAAAGIGAWIVVIAAGRVSDAQVLAAVDRAGVSPASGSGAGTAAGSVTAGTGVGASGGQLAGFPAHVLLAGGSWRALMIGGALLLVLAAAVVLVRANRLPVMSARYERPRGRAAGGTGRRPGRPPGAGSGGSPATGAGAGSGRSLAAGPEPPSGSGPGERRGAVAIWEALSAGADPTTWAGEEDG